MIFRFSLYGFLKNLRFFEAFLLLAFRERGLDFLAIGGLIAVKEITVNVFEIPSGALADGIGRRNCMVASMACYLTAYLLLGLAPSHWLLVAAMVFYGIADAFRTGTHKALIYSWLRSQGREDERTKVYGYTRSWSKIGSAVSALLAGGLVFVSGNYTSIFLWSALPAAINMVNLATYPAWLDAERPRGSRAALRASVMTMWHGLRAAVTQPAMRKLVRDSMVIEGGYAVVKDYLQPVVQAAAIAAPVLLGLSGKQRTAILGAVAYAVLYVLASFASRKSHRWEQWCGSTERSVRWLYVLCAAGLCVLAALLVGGWAWPAIIIFIALGMGQNLWRPIHVGRFDRDGEEKHAATTLSIESQAKAIAAAVFAPLIGWAVDRLSHHAQPAPVTALWPVAVVAIPMLIVIAWDAIRSTAAGGELAEPDPPASSK